MVIADSVPAILIFAPFAKSIAQVGKFSNETVLLPFQAALGFSRSFSPISPANVFIAKFVDVPEIEIIKRNCIPFIAALLTVLISSYFVIS
ncbi:MAG: hypothetical protein LBP27_04120, partial [Treponema sp.]|jgi:C4-dicarboxylate transporter|nr:hypothetical protein [Treponema sp.]